MLQGLLHELGKGEPGAKAATRLTEKGGAMMPESRATPRARPREPGAGWILYDADCGVCTRLARFWEPTFTRLGFNVAPLQSPWVPDHTGLTPAELLTDVRLLASDGSIISGPNVYRHVMRRLWWAYPFYLLSRTPGLSRVFDWGYRAFARNRTRISVSCDLPGLPEPPASRRDHG